MFYYATEYILIHFNNFFLLFRHLIAVHLIVDRYSSLGLAQSCLTHCNMLDDLGDGLISGSREEEGPERARVVDNLALTILTLENNLDQHFCQR